MNPGAWLTTIGLSAFVGAGWLSPARFGTDRSQRRRLSGDAGQAPRRFIERRPPPWITRHRQGPRSAGRGVGFKSARWARPSDLVSLRVPRQDPNSVAPAGRLVLGWAGRKLLAAERSESVIVFGPTQSYKTSGLAVPAILGWEGPVIATSVKTDLVDHTIGFRRSIGDVQCFDPSGVTGLDAAPWSPLPTARTWPGARRAAAALTEVAKGSVGTMSDGDFWYATATKMLAPLLFAAACAGLAMEDVVRWVDTQEERTVLEILSATGVPEAVDAAHATFGKEDRQRSSIYTTVETILEPFAGTAGDVGGDFSSVAGHGHPSATVDPARLLSGRGTLYLCAPAHDQRRLTPLFVSVVRQAVQHVYDQVARTHQPQEPPLLIVLDEAANIAPLADLDMLASTAAGHGVQLMTIWHDLAQISARYGARASTVVNNHRAKIYLSGISDPSTLDHASQLIGDEEVVVPSTTLGGHGSPTTTRSPSRRRLAPPDALRRLPPGEGLLVYGNLPPAHLRLRTWFADPGLRARADAHPEP